MDDQLACLDGTNVKPKLCTANAPRILIVEDDTEVSQVVAQMVSNLGYAPCTCNRPGDVPRFLETQKVDLMLVDYRMPEMTGLDLIFLLRQENKSVPIIMMTGYAQTESRVSAEGLEEFVILKKPITQPQLAKAIEDALKLGRPASRGI